MLEIPRKVIVLACCEIEPTNYKDNLNENVDIDDKKELSLPIPLPRKIIPLEIVTPRGSKQAKVIANKIISVFPEDTNPRLNVYHSNDEHSKARAEEFFINFPIRFVESLKEGVDSIYSL